MPSTYSPGNMGEFWETIEVGWGKVVCWSNISETRKDRGKDTMEGLQELTNALSNGTILDPLRPPLPQDFATPTKTPI